MLEKFRYGNKQSKFQQVLCIPPSKCFRLGFWEHKLFICRCRTQPEIRKFALDFLEQNVSLKKEGSNFNRNDLRKSLCSFNLFCFLIMMHFVCLFHPLSQRSVCLYFPWKINIFLGQQSKYQSYLAYSNIRVSANPLSAFPRSVLPLSAFPLSALPLSAFVALGEIKVMI